MTVYWVDIEDSAGVKQGFGPILSAQAWTHTAQLDRAGTFSFTMPADDPRRNNLRVKYIARCWTYDGGQLKHLGAGIINDIALRIDAEGAPVLTVSGDDLLHELTYRNVGELDLSEEVIAHPAYVFYVPESTAVDSGDDSDNRTQLEQLQDAAIYDTTTGAALDWQMMVRWTIVKDPRPFRSIIWTVSTVNYKDTPDDPDGFIMEYWSNDVDGVAGWQALTATASADLPWSTSTYTLTWDIPSDWTIRAGEANYKIRFQPNHCHNGIGLTDCAVVHDRPSTDALTQIMGHAPGGWSLDAANGYASIARATELGTNLITNGDFELYTGGQDDGASDITSWSELLSGTGTIESTAASHAGASAVKITNAAQYDSGALYQIMTVADETDYLLHLWTKGDGTRDGVYRAYAIIGSEAEYITPYLYTGNSSTTWQEQYTEISAPSGTTGIGLMLLGPWYLFTGNASWDDVTLYARTGGEVALKFANESILEALIRVA